MSELLQCDEALFRLINGVWHTPWLDALLPYWREKTSWIPLYVAMAGYFAYLWRSKAVILLLAIVLTVGLADLISHRVIKQSVQRPRPCREEALAPDVRLLVNCGGGYSFTSNHAANHFALAAFLFGLLKDRWRRSRWLWVAWAASIAYAQVYVGLHYPLDVLGGGILGWALGWLGFRLYRRWEEKKGSLLRGCLGI